MEVLARGANFEITAAHGVARCVVINSPGVTREEGARCADLMRDVLSSRVLAAGSGYTGLVFDVRRGPEVFGPVTRALLEQIFRAAEISRRRLAVRVGSGATQRLQFSSLCSECAPRHARVVEDDFGETQWLRSSGSSLG